MINSGYPQMAVGAARCGRPAGGAVARLDVRSGRLVALVRADASRLAAGREGVWYISGVQRRRRHSRSTHVRIAWGQGDRRRRRRLFGIAVGAGSVWVTAEREGFVFRISPGASPAITPIDVGTGVNDVAYGAGALWGGQLCQGHALRDRPPVPTLWTPKTPVGAVQALAAGVGSAWASTAAMPSPGTLPASVCTDEVGGGRPGRRPDRLGSPDGKGNSGAVRRRAMVETIGTVLAERGFRAGKYTVGYRSCDDSTAEGRAPTSHGGARPTPTPSRAPTVWSR